MKKKNFITQYKKSNERKNRIEQNLLKIKRKKIQKMGVNFGIIMNKFYF